MGVRISLILEERRVVVENPHVCLEGGVKQCRVARDVLQLIPTQLPSVSQRGLNLDPPLNSPGGVMHAILQYRTDGNYKMGVHCTNNMFL